MTPAAALWGDALASGAPLRARAADGTLVEVPVGRYLGRVPAVESVLLDRARGPVLDIGCGPARHVLALARRGAFAVGLDVAPGAVGVARGRGAAVLEGSVFDRVPGHGSWGTALLLDGNVGIGGDPLALMGRTRELLRPQGSLLLELAEPGSRSESLPMRIESAGRASWWFPWARLAADELDPVARAAGLTIHELWQGDGRWFAELRTG